MSFYIQIPIYFLISSIEFSILNSLTKILPLFFYNNPVKRLIVVVFPDPL